MGNLPEGPAVQAPDYPDDWPKLSEVTKVQAEQLRGLLDMKAFTDAMIEQFYCRGPRVDQIAVGAGEHQINSGMAKLAHAIANPEF